MATPICTNGARQLHRATFICPRHFPRWRLRQRNIRCQSVQPLSIYSESNFGLDLENSFRHHMQALLRCVGITGCRLTIVHNNYWDKLPLIFDMGPHYISISTPNTTNLFGRQFSFVQLFSIAVWNPTSRVPIIITGSICSINSTGIWHKGLA